MLRATAAAWLLLAPAEVAQAAEQTRPPLPAPAMFSTHNYELTFAIPPGLFRCPYAPDSIGSDHGITIYLLKPNGCSPGSPVAAGNEPGWPQVIVFYSYNVAEYPPGAGPPRTNARLFTVHCMSPAAIRFEAARLFGKPVDLCVRKRGRVVELEAQSLYQQSADHGGAFDAPSSEVSITLRTTDRRYDADWPKFRAIVASMRVCTANDEPLAPSKPPCPPHQQW